MVKLVEDRAVERIVRVGPFRVGIEFPQDEHGIAYGFLLGTTGLGADGEALDCWVGPDTDAPVVWVATLADPEGRFDEIKLFLGFAEPSAALDRLEQHGRNLIAFEAFPRDELASALREVPRDRPVLVSSPAIQGHLMRALRFGNQAPRPLVLEPADAPPPEPDRTGLADRWPWHARGRWGQLLGTPLDNEGERHGLANQSNPPPGSGMHFVAEDVDEPPLAAYGQHASDAAPPDPLRNIERTSRRVDPVPRTDTVIVMPARVAVRRRLAEVAVMAARAVGADHHSTPGRVWLDVLRWLRDHGREIYLATGFTPSPRECRLIADLVARHVRRGEKPTERLRAEVAVLEATESAEEPSMVLAEAIALGVAAEDLDTLLAEVAPPGMEGLVKKLKRRGGVKNPWALAWTIYNRRKRTKRREKHRA